jgi:hypothetical protein
LDARAQAGWQRCPLPERGDADSQVTRHGRGDPEQADQRAGNQQDRRHAARVAGGDLGQEPVGDQSRFAEFMDCRLDGLSRQQPGRGA